MKLNELVRSLDTWTSREERAMLEGLKGLVSMKTFAEHERFIIEGLIRKSLVIKVQGNNNETYIYPNT
jgi:hypothetical protein